MTQPAYCCHAGGTPATEVSAALGPPGPTFGSAGSLCCGQGLSNERARTRCPSGTDAAKLDVQIVIASHGRSPRKVCFGALLQRVGGIDTL